jgi:hypothetical protein
MLRPALCNELLAILGQAHHRVPQRQQHVSESIAAAGVVIRDADPK